MNPILYAISLGSVGGTVTPALADALRRSKFRHVEISLTPFTTGADADGLAAARTEQLIAEGCIHPVSTHLPFYGDWGKWDPSAPDENERRLAVDSYRKLLTRYRRLLAPMLTLHGGEGPLPEHPRRIEQLRRSLAELMDLAEEFRFRINVEYLPRECVGRTEEELLQIIDGFDSGKIGICLDVNHIMNRAAELPRIIGQLGEHIYALHISDYDGIDEMHWFPWQGVIDWCAVMKAIRALPHAAPLILENEYQLERNWYRSADPIFALRQGEMAVWYLENCERLVPEIAAFRIPGNE